MTRRLAIPENENGLELERVSGISGRTQFAPVPTVVALAGGPRCKPTVQAVGNGLQ